MSQTLILDPDVPEVINPTSSQIHDQERKVSEQRQKRSGTSTRAAGRSILAAILSTLLLRIASRTSFVLLGFYLGEQEVFLVVRASYPSIGAHFVRRMERKRGALFWRAHPGWWGSWSSLARDPGLDWL